MNRKCEVYDKECRFHPNFLGNILKNCCGGPSRCWCQIFSTHNIITRYSHPGIETQDMGYEILLLNRVNFLIRRSKICLPSRYILRDCGNYNS